MTIEEAIDKADALQPNAYTLSQKTTWLSQLDNQVYEEVLLMAKRNYKPDTMIEKKIENGIEVEVEVENPRRLIPAFDFTPYDETTPLDTPLLIDDLYAGCYIDYLISKYNLYNRESETYNNSVTVFNSIYQTYVNWYRRNNEPIRRRVQGI